MPRQSPSRHHLVRAEQLAAAVGQALSADEQLRQFPVSVLPAARGRGRDGDVDHRDVADNAQIDAAPGMPAADTSDEKPTVSPTPRVRNRQVGCELTS
jgi:hypothetical protein